MSDPENRFSECGRKYLAALKNPFDATDVCLPLATLGYTRKSKVKVRGTAAASSSTGFGYVVVNPVYLAVNDAAGCWATDATYGGSTVSTSITTGVQAYNSDAMVQTSDLGNDLRIRVASVGIEAEVTNSVLTHGGEIMGMTQYDHLSLTTLTAADLLKNDNCWRSAIGAGRRCYRVCWNGVSDPDEAQFFSNLNGPANSNACIIIAFQGNVNTTICFDVVVHVEYAGAKARGTTPVWPNIQDQAAAQTVARIAAQSVEGDHNSPQWHRRWASALREAAHMMLPAVRVIAPVVGRAAMGYMVGGPAAAAAAALGSPPKRPLAIQSKPKKKKKS